MVRGDDPGATVATMVAGVVVAAVALLALSFALDYMIFPIRVATNRQPYGTVTVRPYDAVQQKNGKTEFLFDRPQVTTCVQALFPHQGYAACWYLRRHPEQRTDI
jgi:hypothetical protein